MFLVVGLIRILEIIRSNNDIIRLEMQAEYTPHNTRAIFCARITLTGHQPTQRKCVQNALFLFSPLFHDATEIDT